MLVAEYPWGAIDGSLQHAQHDLAALGLVVSILVVDRAGSVIGGGSWQEPSTLLGRDLVADGWLAGLAQEKEKPSYAAASTRPTRWSATRRSSRASGS